MAWASPPGLRRGAPSTGERAVPCSSVQETEPPASGLPSPIDKPMRRLIVATAMLTLAASSLPASPPETVVLLHGLGRGPLAMKRLEHTLRNRGFEVLNIGYASQEHDIATLADRTLSPLLGPDAPHTRVHIVTHSLGGILVRKYLADHGTPAHLGRVVMIAPPNQGSEIVDRLRTWRLYRWLNGPAGLQLGTGPDAVPVSLGPLPGDVDVGVIAGDFSWNPLLSACIAGANDGKVSVARTHVAGERDHLTVRSSHTWIMWRRKTIEQVLAFLREGSFGK